MSMVLVRDFPARAFGLGLLAFLLLSIAAHGQQLPRLDPEGQLRRYDSLHARTMGRNASDPEREDVEGRDEWFCFQRRYPYDRIPAGARLQAMEMMQQMQRTMDQSRAQNKSTSHVQSAASRWQEIGPVNRGGRVRAIAARPDGVAQYIGAAAGGVWRTFDGGSNWAPLFDKQNSLAVCALAIDYTAQDTMYAGTGENSVNIDAYSGAGIYRSGDAGDHWQYMGLSNVGAFSKIYVHRQKHNIIYAAATKSNSGFYRSEDFGATWKLIVSGNFYDMSVNPQNSDEVYISSENAISRSSDGGKTFTGAASGITIGGARRISVCVAESSPNIVWALVGRSGGPNSTDIADIYSSTNKGTSWTLVKSYPDGSFFRDQSWYDNFITVSPVDPNVVLIGGIDVFRTLNNGQTWTNLTRSYNGGIVHPDQHMALFDPTSPEIVYLTNDGGVFASYNTGDTWEKISNTLPVTQYYAMDVDQVNRYRVYGGTQDNGSHGTFGTSSFSQQWKSILGGDGFYTIVDPADPDYVYAENYNGKPLYRVNVGESTPVPTSIGGTIPEDGAWSTPLAMSTVDKVSLYSGRRKLWRTADGGENWVGLTPGNSDLISAIGLSYHDTRKLMIGTRSAEARTSTDYGVTWTTPTGLPGRYITCIRYDPLDANRVYLTVSGYGTGHVFRSDNSGQSFADLSASLPNVPVNSIDVDPANNQHLFAGTDIGVFYSPDAGQSWFPFNDGLALSPVVSLRIQAASRMLVAATHGRSMWTVSIDNPAFDPVLVFPTGGENLAVPAALTVRWAGMTAPVDVLVSYNGGSTYQTAVSGATGSTAVVNLPMVKTTTARVRVQETGGSSRALNSGNFTLTPAANANERGNIGFTAEAIAYRNRELWFTVRGNDTMYRSGLPFLTVKIPVVRTGVSGKVRDLDYDSVAGVFYVLTADADFGNAKIYRMDTNGVALGQVSPLPASGISGIAVTNLGLAITTPGSQDKLYVINPATGAVVVESQAMNLPGDNRVGLVWDGGGLVQGVMGRNQTADFNSEVQRFSQDASPALLSLSPIVVPSNKTVWLFGMTFDYSNSDHTQRVFFATDTAGIVYRFVHSAVFGGVQDQQTVAGRAATMSITGATPNPVRSTATLRLKVSVVQNVDVGLYTATGQRVLDMANGRMEPGTHDIALKAGQLPSGVYYVTVTGSAGDRLARSVVVLK